MKLFDIFLLASGLWGAYSFVLAIIFLDEIRTAILEDAEPLIIFMAMVSLASGLWLVLVGGSRLLALFGKGNAGSPRRARARLFVKVTVALAAAWLMCLCLIFSRMFAYVYLSTFGLLLLGFYGVGDSIRKLLQEQKKYTHVLVLTVGALSISLGLFAFVGALYRFAFGESWAIVIRQFLASIALGGIGALLIARRWRVVQLALSLLAISLVAWRFYDCMYQVPEFKSRMRGMVENARDQGCGRYERWTYYGRKEKPMDLVEISTSLGYGSPDCDSIPTPIQVRREGVVLNEGTMSPGGDHKGKQDSEFIDGLRWGVSQGLMLVVERDVLWKVMVPLVETARQIGNQRLQFLFRRRMCSEHNHKSDMVPEHRLTSEIEEIASRKRSTASISCARLLNRIDAYCPRFHEIFSVISYGDFFDKIEVWASSLPWAAVQCLGDIDLVAVEILVRCFFQFDLLYVASVPIAGPDDPWAKEIALPADMPWEIAYKHVLKAIALEPYQRQPPLPLRLLVGEPSADSPVDTPTH
jgi:hypothetical protein